VAANQERRHERRISAINLVNIEIDSGDAGAEELVGRTLDLSQDGMRVELSHALPLGSPVRVRFALVDRLLDVEAVVRSSADLAGEMVAVGLEFSHIDDDTRAALIAYLKAHP
jgi:c-di-GMP-binding flagellar brake protein YcgR